MKSLIILMICVVAFLAIINLLCYKLDKYINTNTKFGKWWRNNIVHELDENNKVIKY